MNKQTEVLLIDIYHKTVEVRSLQKRYFRKREKSILSASKQAEGELDAMLLKAAQSVPEAPKTGQTSLFDSN